MALKIGIVGLPNVGKSSLFNLLTKSNVRVENFPFSTIKPNFGTAEVYDFRINQLANITGIHNIIPPTIEFIDIAGLIRGSYKGEGLGNQFLSKIRETQAIAQVIRCFENNSVSHITNNIQPTQDINIINTELALSDLEICERNIKKLEKKGNKKQDDLSKVLALKKCILHLNKFGELRSIELNQLEKKNLKSFNFLTMKPIIYIANIDKNKYKANFFLDKIRSIASIQNIEYIKICAVSELGSTNVKENKEKFIFNYNTNISNLKKFTQSAYKILNFHTYFTINRNEIRAWNIPVGTSAIEAAKKIHTEFEKKFVSAKTISFSDFLQYKGEIGTKKAGKIKYKGKNYIVKDGDIIKFLLRN